jgi:hypothetical protein
MSEKQIQVKCIKDVVMNDDGSVAFVKGKTYDAVQNGSIIQSQNEQGYKDHYIKDFDLVDWFDRHFVIVFEEKEELPEYVKTLLELERKELENIVTSRKEKVESRKFHLQEAEESLAKAESQLADVLKVLEG